MTATKKWADVPADAQKRILNAVSRAWGYISQDAGRTSRAGAVELACDAGRLIEYGKLSEADDRLVGEVYNDRAFQRAAAAVI